MREPRRIVTAIGGVALAVGVAATPRDVSAQRSRSAPSVRQSSVQSTDAPMTSAQLAAHPLTLDDVIHLALRDDPDIQLGERTADGALGAAISAHSAYDVTVQTSVAHSRTNGLRLAAPTQTGAAPSIESSLSSSVVSSVAAQKRLPWGGIVLAPQFSVTGAGTPGTIAQSRASTALGVTMPLARDRGGALVSNVENAANAAADASNSDLRQQASASVLQAASAYWAFIAAQRRLDALRATEERAKRNLEQAIQLVAADERPAADLVQLRGSVAGKVSSRIAGEQALLDAWRTLAARFAVGDQDITAIPVGATDFPALPDSLAMHAAPSVADTRAMIDDALRHRADLSATITRVHQSEYSVRAATHLTRPVIDLVAQVGYSGLETGWGVNQYLSPLYRNWSPLNASLQFVYEFAAVNSDATGQLRQAAAGLDAQRISRAVLERSITTGVVVALNGVRRSIASAQAAQVSTAAAAQSVENELRMFRLGSATVIDVILSEDALTNAQLAEIAARQSYAVAIARLQYELGTLVSGDRGSFTGNVASLLRSPAIIATP